MAEADLSVAWIARLPRIDYVWNSADPAVEGWPEPGQRVKWVAQVRNVGEERLNRVEYRWLLDGQVVASGSKDFRRRAITKIRLPWRWERRRHELVFEIDPLDAIAEREERNNRLLVHTDALGVGLWVERPFWTFMQELVSQAGIGASTFEDWAQKRIQQYNEMAELAVYPETPNGVLDRWRIDAIHLVPNGALPIVQPGPEVRDWGAPPSAYPTLYPNSADRSIDMEWGFPGYATDFYDHYEAYQLLYDSQIHELGHARYLIDVYGWNVSANNDDLGVNPPSDSFGNFHFTPDNGLMNTSWGYIDRYSAAALNQIAGHRATQGHYNEPTNIGEFLNDLPAENRIRIVSPSGQIYPRRAVRLYRASGEIEPDWETFVLRLKIDGTADAEYETDNEGKILVGRNPFADGPVISAVDQNNTLAILELVDGPVSRWGYLEARELNLAYWRGETQLAEHDLVVDAPICPGPGLGPADVAPFHGARVAPGEVTFEWPAAGSVGPFELWYTINGRRRRLDVARPPTGDRVSATLPVKGRRVAWWLVYRQSFSPPECPPVRSATYYFELDDTGGSP
jgi:hypothetical protein